LRECSLVVGLGNPGTRYRFTRHNIGFMVLDRVALDLNLVFENYGTLGLLCRGDSDRRSIRLLKPLTFMNRSGIVVGDLVDRLGIPFAGMLVVSDDFSLPLGRMRFRRKGSPGGHKGLESITGTMGTDDFPRLRIGIGPLPRGMDPVEFVLGNFEGDELGLVKEVLGRTSEAVRFWLEAGEIELCMNRFN
jgi:PTH1 family peptidyl-tRNA hydrolase